jgi:hypothetical protein
VAKLEPCRASGDENPVGLPDQSAGHHLRELRLAAGKVTMAILSVAPDRRIGVVHQRWAGLWIVVLITQLCCAQSM